jgi:general L-amino acid transport system substrate-binding protein
MPRDFMAWQGGFEGLVSGNCEMIWIRNMKKLSWGLALVLVLGSALAAAASTLDEVKARGKLFCGVNTGLQGFAQAGADGQWTGFDVDYCRAIAAAVLGDGSKVEFIPLTAQARFEALQTNKIDILARNTTWTMERETKLPLRFVGVSYHDGQGFLVKKAIGVASVYNLGQAAICFVSGTTTQANVEEFFREREMAYSPVVFDNAELATAAYEEGKCDSYTTDQSQLYAVRLKLKRPDEHVILPEVISKEPLGPVVRQGDEQWFNIARWTLFALINAEELGLKAANVADAKEKSKSADIRRLLGLEGTLGANIGLDTDWGARAILAGGHYGEIFERNLGTGSPLGILRGLNAPWNQGGILYAPSLK